MAKRVIQDGDTLTKISEETGVPVEDIAAANGIKNINRIYAGDIIEIPDGTGNTTTTTPTTPTEPKSYSDIDLGKYDGGYDETKDSSVSSALEKASKADQAVNTYGDFKYSQDEDFKAIMDKILNREQFSYDLNGDALYQQYKDSYMQQGKMAMQDTMGQAAAMTGGYGNSYASTAGNQAYQAHLQELNNIVPELYQMAYDRYNQEGQDMYNQYAMLSDDRSTEYGMYMDDYNKLLTDRDYYRGVYDSEYAKGYGEWSDNRDFDTNQYWNETNFGYTQDRDRVSDEQWQKEFDEARRQHNEEQAFLREQWEYQKAHAGSSSSGSGSGSGSGGGGGGNNEGQFTYVSDKTTKDFKNLLVLQSEFVGDGRGAVYNGVTYPPTVDGYKDYVSAKILDALDEGKLNDNQAKSILMDLGIE